MPPTPAWQRWWCPMTNNVPALSYAGSRKCPEEFDQMEQRTKWTDERLDELERRLDFVQKVAIDLTVQADVEHSEESPTPPSTHVTTAQQRAG